MAHNPNNDELIKNALRQGDGLVENAFNSIKSQHELNTCNDGKRSSEMLLSTIEELEKVKKERDRYYNALMSIQYETPALGGDEEDMEHALYNINWLCDWALRPDEMKEMEKNNGI